MTFGDLFDRIFLITQLVIFVGKLSVDFIRSWILLHMNTRINIALISDFLAKLMRLPLHFFDTKMIGDIMQRIGDHGRIESFLTGSSINTLCSNTLAWNNRIGRAVLFCWFLGPP